MTTSRPAVTEVSDQLKRITECNRCREAFRDPIILSCTCIHTFCMSCISQAGTEANKRSGEQMPCPLCRKEFTIPMCGFEGLEKNVFIQRMVEMRKLLERTSGRIPCDICNDETANESNAVVVADSHCPECRLNLCEQCCAHHRRSKLTREHILREGASLTDRREPEEVLQARICSRHKEEMKLYCKKCSEVLCPMCFIDNHQGHERSSVAEAGDDFRKQIQVSINDIDECTSKATIKKELIEREMERISKRTERLEKEVMERRDDLKELVDKHATIILEQLRTRKSEKMKEIEVQQVETESHLSSLESYKDYSSLFVVYGTNGEICKKVSDLKARATELLKENDAAVQRQLIPCQLLFTASTLDKFFNFVENLIGEIKDSDDEEHKPMSEGNITDENIDTSDVIQTQSEQHVAECEADIKAQEFEERSVTKSTDAKGNKTEGTKTFRPKTIRNIQTLKTKQNGRPIWGLAVLNNELFISKAESSQIEVYDALSYKFKRQWDIHDLSDPQDIVSCAGKECLLIMNWDGGYNPAMILKADRNGKVLTSWSMKIGGGRLSITPELTVIVTAYGKNKMYEYSLDGELIKEIKLPAAYLNHPQHAVKLADGRFLVCSGGANDLLHTLCIVNQRGSVLKSFGGEGGSDNQSLSRPLHLAVDGDGYIYVADWSNRRVLLLDSDLQFQKELVTRKAGLLHPGRIFLDSSNNQLLLANNAYGIGPGHVLICRFNQQLR